MKTDVDVIYSIRATHKDDNDVRVLKFTSLFLPDTEKRRKEMERYNKKEMNELAMPEDEIGRRRKRVLKENYKKTIERHARKSKYLPVNPFMEDFHFLQGYSKSGVAP